MRRIAFQLLAACSLLGMASAATRPHYGGTLRVLMQSSPSVLEVPANSGTADYWDAVQVLALVADPLVSLDPQRGVQPRLATAWQSDAGARRWLLTIRRGARFQDGSPLTASAIAQIIGPLHPDWRVQGSGDMLTIESDNALPFLLAELAQARNAIVKRTSAGIPVGTGAFRIAEFQPGKSLKLAANEDCWNGRPYVDAIEVEFGKSFRDQAIALELGRVDVVETSPSVANAGSQRVRTSLPVELVALVFASNSKTQDPHVREALALSIDRKPIQSVLLKGAGDPSASLIPNWMTGYAGLFSTQANVQRAKALLADSRLPSFTLTYDPRDPQAQLIAERIALNAREAGITLQVSLSGTPDITLVRIALPSPDPATSLREVVRQLGQAQVNVRSDSVEDLYQAEHSVLDSHFVIPLFHLPLASAASARVRNWDPDRLGSWNLPDTWVEADTR